LAEERIEKAGLGDSIRVHLMDYRDIPKEWEGSFDAFVSIEMLEVCVNFLFLFVVDLNKFNVMCCSTSDPSITTPISN
jgi:hypothetical protein